MNVSPRASPRSVLTITMIILNMRGHVVDGWIHLVTHSIAEGCLKNAKKTPANMMMCNPLPGQPVQRCLSGQRIFMKPEALMNSSLHTRKRSICAGGCNYLGKRSSYN